MSDLEKKYVGKFGTFNVPIKGAEPGGFHVPIRVLGATSNCGRIDLTVEPVGGEGAAKVRLTNVTLNDQ